MKPNKLSDLGINTERQLQADKILQTLGVFDKLREYSPVLVGTIPLGVDVPNSDLDIICEVHDLSHFEHQVIIEFGQHEGFRIRQTAIGGVPSVISNFTYGGFLIEIFGQPRPVVEQEAYCHMQVESRLLLIGGDEARQTIRRLKQSGLKTEPAFAQYFLIEGDPYQRLLELAVLSDKELGQIVHGEKDCIFCDIVAHRRKASRVYEDEYTVAFVNLRQANEGHVLVVPKEHYPNICELNNEIASHLLSTVVIIARATEQSFEPEGITIWQSNGEAAGQEIEHVHFHILPRYTGDEVIQFYPELPQICEQRKLDRIAKKIREALSN